MLPGWGLLKHEIWYSPKCLRLWKTHMDRGHCEAYRPHLCAVVRPAVFSCPTFRNDVYFELGGLAAEKDGYPVLFTSTHNTSPVDKTNAVAKRQLAWDLAMVYVNRDFDTKTMPRNRYDIV